MVDVSIGKSSSAQGCAAEPLSGSSGPATGGSVEDISRTRQPLLRRADNPGNSETGDSREDQHPRGTAAFAVPTDLGRRIQRMYLISARSEYRLLAQPQRVAFRDMGRRLVTEHDDPTVVRGMLDVAQHKGWERVNLAGSETFRRLAWLEARSRGLQTIGYVPNREDRDRLSERLAECDGEQHRAAGVLPAGAKGDASNRGRLPRESRAFHSNDPEVATARHKVGTGDLDARDAMLLAVAEEVLRKRQVGEATRARVAAAIVNRLAVLREKGAGVSVRAYDTSARSSDVRPVVPHGGRPEVVRSR